MICWCIDWDQLWQKFCATSATLMESLTSPNLTKATMTFMRKQKPTPVALSAGSGGQDETVMFRNWRPHGSSGSSHHQFVIPARLQVGVLSGSGDCNCSRFFSGEERNARFRKCAGTCWNTIESGMKVFSMASLETRTALLVTVHLDMSMKHGCNSHEFWEQKQGDRSSMSKPFFWSILILIQQVRTEDSQRIIAACVPCSPGFYKSGTNNFESFWAAWFCKVTAVTAPKRLLLRPQAVLLALLGSLQECLQLLLGSEGVDR